MNIAIEGEVNVATAPQLKEDLEGEADGVEVV